MTKESDLTPEELKEQEEQAKQPQFESSLPENSRTFYQRPDFAKELVSYKFKPPESLAITIWDIVGGIRYHQRPCWLDCLSRARSGQ